MTTWLQSLQMNEILVYGLALGLPFVAIGFSAVATVVNAIIKHSERMAMINQGLDPDRLSPEVPQQAG